MIKISNLHSRNTETLLNTDSSTRKNTINHKIYNVGRRIFGYLYQNQTAFAAALWSYWFIEVGMVAAQITFGEEYVDNIDSCQKIICEHWNTDIENRSQFSPVVEYRCSSTHNDIFPSYSFRACMNDLCNYMNNIRKEFYPCIAIFNQNNMESDFNISHESIPYSNKFTAELWNQLCPKKEGGHSNLKEENAYINQCMKKLCDHYVVFKINLPLDKATVEWCQNININRLFKSLANLTEIINEAQKKAEVNEDWMKANVIASIVGALTGVTISAFTLAGTIITYRATSVASEASIHASNAIKDMPTLLSGLRQVTNSAVHVTKAVVEISTLTSSEIIPIETINVLSQISDSLSYYSSFSVENLPALTPEINIVAPDGESFPSSISESRVLSLGEESISSGIEGFIGAPMPRMPPLSIGTALVGGGGIGMGTGIIVGSGLQSVIKDTVQSSGIMSSAETSTGSTMYTEQVPHSFFTNQININYVNRMIQDYLNDYMVSFSQGSDILLKQVFRLKNSLQYWQNAFCFYKFPDNLACRLPKPNQFLIHIPLENLQTMFSKELMGLCYLFQDQLWCNWAKFLDIVSVGGSVSTDQVNCAWDQLFIKIKEIVDGLYEIQLKGGESGCYNKTITIRT